MTRELAERAGATELSCELVGLSEAGAWVGEGTRGARRGFGLVECGKRDSGAARVPAGARCRLEPAPAPAARGGDAATECARSTSLKNNTSKRRVSVIYGCWSCILAGNCELSSRVFFSLGLNRTKAKGSIMLTVVFFCFTVIMSLRRRLEETN